MNKKMLKLKQKKYWDMENWSTVATEFKITGQNSVQSQILWTAKSRPVFTSSQEMPFTTFHQEVWQINILP